MKDGYDFNVLSEQGICIVNQSPRILEYSIESIEKTRWIEKRLGELIWKLKVNRARKNKWIVAGLMAISTIILIGLTLLICLLGNPLLSIAFGFLDVQLFRLAYSYLTDIFECNPSYYLPVKHNGKIYR